jgi:hypothetical protein
MTRTNFSLPTLDIEEERQRALAKIYSLLIKLAERAENRTTKPDILSEKVVEPTVPLKENIPPSAL